MKLNTKVRYGLRAIIDIAENQHEGGVLQKDINERQGIPLKYLDTIITGLRNHGLIINVRGKRSGYKLAKPASEISVYEVYRAFEPELSLVNCLYESVECNHDESCPSRDYWFELNKNLKSQMQKSSLEQIMRGTFKL